MSEYDRIIRESIKEAIKPLIRKILAIPVLKIESLNTDLPVTDERKPDFLVRVDSVEDSAVEQSPFIIHLEFQSTNDPVMHYRMLRYRSYLAITYKLPVRQFVIFVGNDTPAMRNGIIDIDLIFRYCIINLQDIDCRLLIESDNPEEIVLSLLCRPIEDNRRLTIRLILDNLKRKTGSGLGFGKFTRQLEILSCLRKAQDTVIEEIKTMPITIDISDDHLYKDGITRGMLLGVEKTRIETARKLKEKGFDYSMIAEVTGLSIDEIEKA
jgi:hypothetical protein